MEFLIKHCRVCDSTKFRLSSLRPGDVFRMLILQYPIRCMECGKRNTVLLPLALKYRRNNPHTA